jgi:uncharacterized protein YdgA (DUF945 family)
VKKSVLALILLAVLIIIVSPGIVGKFAENTVGENLNWAARESGELVVTSEGFDRGWFSSEGQHRVEIANGSLRTAMTTAAGGGIDAELPVLLISTHIDHGLIPVSSLGREEGSLAPGLGNAVSTVAIDVGDGEQIDLPGAIYSKIGLTGDLDSHYVVEAGSKMVDGGEVTWQPSSINITSSPKTASIRFEGDVGAMTFGNDQQTVSIDGLNFVGQQAPSSYGFNVGSVELEVGAMTTDASGVSAGGMQGLSINASSSVDGSVAAAAMRMEMRGQTIPGFGDISINADIGFSDLDATALGALTQKLEGLGGALDPDRIMMAAEEEFKNLFAAGLGVGVQQLDVDLPMGTVEMKMTIEVPESDRAAFEWSSLLLDTVASLDVRVPEALVQLASSMNPQTGAIIGMGYLKKEGDVYIMDADLKQGLLTINGAPIPIPLGAFQ